MDDERTHIVFICGSALRGQPDHENLHGAEFLGEAASAPRYRLHSVKDGWHPGIREVQESGISIPGELYQLTDKQYDYLVATEPPDMYPAVLELQDDTSVTAMFYPDRLIREHNWPDISDYGGWASYKRAKETGD